MDRWGYWGSGKLGHLPKFPGRRCLLRAGSVALGGLGYQPSAAPLSCDRGGWFEPLWVIVTQKLSFLRSASCSSLCPQSTQPELNQHWLSGIEVREKPMISEHSRDVFCRIPGLFQMGWFLYFFTSIKTILIMSVSLLDCKLLYYI